jgi:hypothetical protein
MSKRTFGNAFDDGPRLRLKLADTGEQGELSELFGCLARIACLEARGVTTLNYLWRFDVMMLLLTLA